MVQIALLTGLMVLAQAQPKAAPKAAAKAPDLNAPKLEDPAPDKAALRVVTDGKKHYLAYPKADGFHGPHYWSADGKDFYKLRSFGGGAEGDIAFNISLWEPRIRGRGVAASFDFRDSKWSVECGDRKTAFTGVADAEAKTLLDTATFYGSRWRRKPYALARDDKGSYFFVDHLRDDEGKNDHQRDFRIFMGPRGALKEQKMTNLVNDSEGDIFSTKSGEFRLLINSEKNAGSGADRGPVPPKWVSGGKESKLTNVPIEDNVQVIYNDLGVYEGARLGTPCDEL